MSGATHRRVVLDVIEKYKESTCLWKVSDPAYHDKVQRGLALENILHTFKKADPNATVQAVMKKIGSLRGAFRKEVNKVKASMKSGAAAEDIHIPKLWYYDKMLFLEDQETPPRLPTMSYIDEFPFGEEEEFYEEAESNQHTRRNGSARYPDTGADGTGIPEALVEFYEEASNGPAPIEASPKLSQGTKRPKSRLDDVLDKITTRLDSPKKHQAFGEHIAEKLRGFENPLMVACVQKIINDAIFYAETGQLNSGSKIEIHSDK